MTTGLRGIQIFFPFLIHKSDFVFFSEKIFFARRPSPQNVQLAEMRKFPGLIFWNMAVEARINLRYDLNTMGHYRNFEAVSFNKHEIITRLCFNTFPQEKTNQIIRESSAENRSWKQLRLYQIIADGRIRSNPSNKWFSRLLSAVKVSFGIIQRLNGWLKNYCDIRAERGTYGIICIFV